MSSDGEIPEERCEFLLEPGDVPGDGADEFEAGSDEWYVETEAVCCWREVWDSGDGDQCIWHAESDDKPPDALIDAHKDRPERLDGAYVPAVDLSDAIDFEECGLQAATFDGTGLQEASFEGVDGRFAQFRDASLRWAQFPDADLRGALFRDADLRGALFPDPDLRQARFPDANLRRAQFPDADLRQVEFPDANLRHTQFPDADVRQAEFPDADLHDAEFPETSLRWAQFPDADLRWAQFPDADLRGALFPEASLQEAQFPNADLPAAQFPDADLREALFPAADLSGSQFPAADLRGASFHEAHMGLGAIQEGSAEFDGATVFGWSELELSNSWERAAWTYRSFQQTLSEHALPGEVRRYRVREMHARRQAAREAGNPLTWAKLALARWTTLYGESPYRIVATALVVIAGWTLLYPNAGGFETTSGETTTVANLSRVLAVPDAVASAIEPWLTSFYFSVVTFTTVGYGDLQPATDMGRVLASVETFLGALLMALLVYVLGRRATW